MDKIVIAEITGGLGNQMFQLASALNYSKVTKRKLLLYYVHYYGNTKRAYSLGKFDFNVPKISVPNAILYIIALSLNIFKRGFGGLIKTVSEENISYNEKEWIVILKGYWQSEKYFKSIRSKLLKIFTAQINSNVISDSDSVAIHVRRGDYVSDTVANKTHGFLGIKYYQTAIDKLTNGNKNLKFYFFSDDIKWCKENFKGINYKFIDNIEDPVSEIIMMSKAKNTIIANSSFSWWSAWLNQNPNKIVICPKIWFNTNTNSDTPLNEWIKL